METAFEDIIAANKDRIYRMCRAYATEATDADDIFQEVLLQIWKALPSFRQQSALSTWVYRICMNVCIRQQYNNKKAKKHLTTLDERFVAVVPAPDQNDRQQKIDQLHACIRKLPETERAIMALFLEDMSYREIGQITGLTENHIAVKVKRIKGKLFNCLK